MPKTTPIADAQRVAELIDQLVEQVAAGVAERGDSPLAIVGIRRRGDVLARRLAERIDHDHTGLVDITLYRDDLSEIGPQPTVRTTEIGFGVDGATIVLVDDVLMTGRSVRAALQTLIDYGRPRCVKLAVLVDRGGRELPIAPDFVALTNAAAPDEHVKVRLTPTDDKDAIVWIKR